MYFHISKPDKPIEINNEIREAEDLMEKAIIETIFEFQRKTNIIISDIKYESKRLHTIDGVSTYAVFITPQYQFH